MYLPRFIVLEIKAENVKTSISHHSNDTMAHLVTSEKLCHVFVGLQVKKAKLWKYFQFQQAPWKSLRSP